MKIGIKRNFLRANKTPIVELRRFGNWPSLRGPLMVAPAPEARPLYCKLIIYYNAPVMFGALDF